MVQRSWEEIGEASQDTPGNVSRNTHKGKGSERSHRGKWSSKQSLSLDPSWSTQGAVSCPGVPVSGSRKGVRGKHSYLW